MRIRTLIVQLVMVAMLIAVANGAQYPLLGGPGLVHVQSAKTGLGLSYRSFTAGTSYGEVNYYGSLGRQDALGDVWSYHSVGYAPNATISVMVTGVAHGEDWTVKSSQLAQGRDKTLGCPGDAFLSGKYHMSPSEMFDLSLEPIVSIPMDKKKYQDDPSQSGKVDVGAKVLSDISLGAATVFVNAGYLTRGEERAMVPVGAGVEYGLNEKVALFAEASGELRLGEQKDIRPDTLYPTGRGFDRTVFRVTPGVRVLPFEYGAVNLSADIGLTSGTPPWQVILGIDIPSSAGRFLSTSLLGAITGLIKDRESGVPMKGMITFPGSDVPGVVSDDLGSYVARLAPADYKIHIYANGYRWIERKIHVKAGKNEKWDLTLKRKLGTIAGRVVDGATGLPLAAALSFIGSKLPELSADPSTGEFTMLVPPGKYRLAATADGYAVKEVELTVKDRDNQTTQFALLPVGMIPAEPAVATGGTRGTTGEATVASLPTASTEPRLPKPPLSPKLVRTTAPANPKTPTSAINPVASTKLTPAEVAALYKTGVEQFMNEEYDKALGTFQKVLKSDPGNAKAKEYLGKTKDRLKKLKG